MSENMKKIRKALIGISLCSKNSMSSKAECGSLAREALLILDAHVAALSEQDVEGFIKNTPCLVRGERFYSESDLRTWMAGHARVPAGLTQVAIRDIEKLQEFAPIEERIFTNSTLKLLYKAASQEGV